jgi:hypothetical protein
MNRAFPDQQRRSKSLPVNTLGNSNCGQTGRIIRHEAARPGD